MKLSDFDFDLPETPIATRPANPRLSARLLVAEGDALHDRRVTDLTDWLGPGDRLCRTIPADPRTAERHSPPHLGPGGGAGQDRARWSRGNGTWSALIKPLRKLKIGEGRLR